MHTLCHTFLQSKDTDFLLQVLPLTVFFLPLSSGYKEDVVVTPVGVTLVMGLLDIEGFQRVFVCIFKSVNKVGGCFNVKIVFSYLLRNE